MTGHAQLKFVMTECSLEDTNLPDGAQIMVVSEKVKLKKLLKEAEK